MRRRLALLAVLAPFNVTPALAADPIEGLWLTKAGQTADIAACDLGFCITMTTGPRAGLEIGHVAATGEGAYKGELSNPENGKRFEAKVRLAAETLTLTGCLNALMCQSQDWQRP